MPGHSPKWFIRIILFNLHLSEEIIVFSSSPRTEAHCLPKVTLLAGRLSGRGKIGTQVCVSPMPELVFIAQTR